MENIIDKMIELKQKELARNKRLDNLNQKYRKHNNTFLENIYEKVLFEDEDFNLSVSYCVWHGFSISFNNKTSKYSVYNVFSSYSWFNECVTNIYIASELSNFKKWENDIKEDLSGLKEILKQVDEHFNNNYVIKRHQSFYDFISSQVKIILS